MIKRKITSVGVSHKVHPQDVSKGQLGTPGGHLVVTGAPGFGSLRLFPCCRPDQVSVDVVLAQELTAFLPVSSLGFVGPA